MPRIAFIALLLCGCNKDKSIGNPIPQAQFSDILSEAWCERHQECELGEFLNDFKKNSACIEHQTRVFEDLIDGYEGAGCTYDENQAGGLQESILLMTCARFLEEDYLLDYPDVYACR